MCSVNGNDYLPLHKVRQKDLEAEAANDRLVKELKQNGAVSPLRQRVGSLLIELGKKIAQESQQDARLVLSARHQS